METEKIDRRRFNPGRPRKSVVGPSCRKCGAETRPRGTAMWACPSCGFRQRDLVSNQMRGTGETA